LDIIMPAHNEEHRIGPTLESYRSVCADPDTRIVVALDACTDRTAEIVADHARRDRRIVAQEFPKLGKGGVLTESFARSDADLVAFVDADGATPPGELLRLADAAAEVGGAIASRRHPSAVLPAERPLPRRLTSAGFSFAVRRLLGLPYRDTQCGAKVLRRDVVDDVLPALTTRDLLFDVDLLQAAGDRGHRLAEVPTIWVDRDGSRVDPVRDTRRMGAGLLRLWAARRRRVRRGTPAVPSARGRRAPAVRAPAVSAAGDRRSVPAAIGAERAGDPRSGVPAATRAERAGERAEHDHA
jgi:glycosyltransferase involved in cell wall biosynthesis